MPPVNYAPFIGMSALGASYSLGKHGIAGILSVVPCFIYSFLLIVARPYSSFEALDAFVRGQHRLKGAGEY